MRIENTGEIGQKREKMGVSQAKDSLPGVLRVIQYKNNPEAALSADRPASEEKRGGAYA